MTSSVSVSKFGSPLSGLGANRPYEICFSSLGSAYFAGFFSRQSIKVSTIFLHMPNGLLTDKNHTIMQTILGT